MKSITEITTFIFLSLLNKKRLRLIEIIGIIFGFLGVLCLVINLFEMDSVNIKYIWGCLLAIMYSLISAIYCTSLTKINIVSEDLAVTFLYSSLFYFALHFLYEEPFLFSNIGQVFVIIPLVVCGYGSFLWNYALQNKANIKILASFSYFIPLVSSLLLWIFLKIELTPYIFISAFFIIGGAILCNARQIEKGQKRKISKGLYYIIMYPHLRFKKKK
jgi:drug/metabolite transporter (DMT)-like permease